MDVKNAVLKAIRLKAGEHSGDIGRNTALEDLKIDSLDMVEIIFDIEQELDVSISYNANDTSAALNTQLKTVGDVCDYIQDKVDTDNK
jgi:acyl carrier protein